MLLELNVKQFAIIDTVHLQFKQGLNILSGETGAGKSVLLKSLALLMGEKSQADTVRSGSSGAVIEGIFDIQHRNDVIDRLNELGIDTSDDLLIVRRLISPIGKSRVYLNDSLASLNSLKEIISPLIEVTGHPSAPLIEMTGQHDSRHLQSKSYHLDILDRYAGVWDLRTLIQSNYSELQNLNERIKKLKEEAHKRDEKLEFLKFQKNEISQLNLRSGEDLELDQRFHVVKNSSKLQEFAQMTENALYGDDDSVLVRIYKILQKGNEISQIDDVISKKLESLTTAKTLIEETVYEIREYGRNLDTDPNELEKLETRISNLRKLQKKYGQTVDEILAKLKDVKEEIELLENFDQSIIDLEKKKKMVHLGLMSQATTLHDKRIVFAKELQKKINLELQDLNMKGVEVSFEVRQLDDLNSLGISDVELMIRSSKTEKAKSLSKFASGGELSRILLVLKKVVGLSDLPRTYLFDEVDTGVSGLTAEKVGRKLKSISNGQQVISVTHLPQVAAFADHHFLIEKDNVKSGPQMKVTELVNKKERVQELARLISGEKITKSSLEHAQSLFTDLNI